MHEPVVLMLAAGFGRRFGSDKTLAQLSDGRPLALASAQALRASGLPVTAVIRPEQRILADLLAAANIRLIETEKARLGMGHSIAAGVAATPNAAGWLIAFADMPWIQAESVIAVANALRDGAEIAVPYYADQRGHPVGFSAKWGAELMRLEGDQGARSLLAGATEVRALALPDPYILSDIDTPTALSMGTAHETEKTCAKDSPS